MAVKSFKPTSPGRRQMTVSTFEEITASKPEKSLLAPAKKHAGRNAQGCITVRHHGGGHKRQYRVIDFKRNKDNIPARVATIEYDPNRSARIALLNYVDGEKRYIIAPNGLKVGDVVVSGPESDIKTGNCLPIANIPVGTMIHCIELKPGKGGQTFIEESEERIKEVRELLKSYNIPAVISVDGGVNDKTISKCRDADIVTAGSYIIGSDNFQTKISSLR